MITAFERVVIAVPDSEAAAAEFGRLLGVARPALYPDPQRAWLGLPNTVLELEQRAVQRARIVGLVLTGSDPGGGEDLCPSPRLELSVDSGGGADAFRAARPELQSPAMSMDHLVLRTADADACIQLYRDRLGIRLALDQTVPEWGGRMLFFRAGKLTLEVIESGGEGKPDYLWGLAFQCPDIEAQARRLAEAGVACSPIRSGRKPGTRVATLKSHTLEIPCLLVEPRPPG